MAGMSMIWDVLYRDYPDFLRPPSYTPNYKFELAKQKLSLLTSVFKEFSGKEPDFTNSY